MRTFLVGVLGKTPIPTPAMVVALLALLVAASGAAVAAGSFTASDGTITACRDNKTGVLRVINAQGGQTCTSKETTITWKDGITGKVADSDKLDGKDSTEFLGANQKAADSGMLDGMDSADFAKAYERTVVVSPVGTDAQNGTALLGALDGITDASASEPYLIYIEPGTYDLGSQTLKMREHVDIEGAGELQTLITSGVDSDCPSGTVAGADNAELRFLTVRNTGTIDCTSAIYNVSTAPRLTHITAEATGEGGPWNAGVWNINDADPAMTGVTATASGGRVNLGVENHDSSPTIKQSKLSGSVASLRQSRGPVQLAFTQLVGPVLGLSSSTFQCFDNYDQDMAAVSCP